MHTFSDFLGHLRMLCVSHFLYFIGFLSNRFKVPFENKRHSPHRNKLQRSLTNFRTSMICVLLQCIHSHRNLQHLKIWFIYNSISQVHIFIVSCNCSLLMGSCLFNSLEKYWWTNQNATQFMMSCNWLNARAILNSILRLRIQSISLLFDWRPALQKKKNNNKKQNYLLIIRVVDSDPQWYIRMLYALRSIIHWTLHTNNLFKQFTQTTHDLCMHLPDPKNLNVFCIDR